MKRMMSAYLILLGFATLYGQQGGDAVDFKKILVNHVGFTPAGRQALPDRWQCVRAIRGH